MTKNLRCARMISPTTNTPQEIAVSIHRYHGGRLRRVFAVVRGGLRRKDAECMAHLPLVEVKDTHRDRETVSPLCMPEKTLT